MKAMLWKKLIVNAGINPIASILNAPNQSVGACDWSRDLVKAVVHEAYQVAEKEKITLNCTEEELRQDVLQVAVNTGTNICSMLADLRNGSRTEIDAITGKIVAFGRTHGVPTPTNEWLVQRIKELESLQQRDALPRKQS
uniref:Ketopantoate reductase C-terminal domain-containing protein n=1 Tax=Globisporangium ultimum (strain ATCC 200006 / CBS 805.95 / DAOM BR144) TaxID=431595 RepID=K3W556_GLOUD